MNSNKKDKTLVAAIDFGSTFSRYAYAFKDWLQKDKNNIYVNTNWGSNPVLSQKTVTCVLFDKDKKFHSFGYKAEKKYASLAEDDEHKDWFFFSRFKMQLQTSKEIKRDMLLDADIPSKKMKAMTVIAESIRYLKGHLLHNLKEQGNDAGNDDIHWIITVPAVWSDPAKQFMRQAAQEAGIGGAQLTIALEPESASMYVQVACDGAKRAIENPGTKFMVIDLGGRTVNITVHEKGPNGEMNELHEPDVGHWGGTVVNQEFNSLLVSQVGAEVYKKFRDDEKLDFLNLQEEFEKIKRKVDPWSDDNYRLKVPVSLPELFKEIEKEDISVAIENSPFKGKLTWKKDKLSLKAPTMIDLFEKSIPFIIEKITTLLGKSKVKDTSVFMLVGGFSESKIIQDKIRKALQANNKKAKIIIPTDAGLAVVKGAVLFGYEPVQIQSRIAKYTFGVNISPAFIPSEHPEDHRVSVGDFDRCRDVFKKYIEVGEVLKVGEEKSGKHITLKPNQAEMLLNLYASPKPDPQFVDEKGAEYMGNVVVRLPLRNEKIKVEVKMKFGDTELAVEATELAANTKYEAYFDFFR